MKIAFIFGPRLVWGRPLDFTRIWDDPRGTTGSEIVVLAYAREMKARGHDAVLFYAGEPNAPFYENVPVKPLSELGDGAAFDVTFSSFGVEELRKLSPKVLRVEDHQVNDLAYAGTDADCPWVDLFITPSESSKTWMRGGAKWVVLGNGCYPEAYDPKLKVPGRCVYISSPDRGLHLLLQAWEDIKAAVPHATLKIFYFALERFLADYRNLTEDSFVHMGEKWHYGRREQTERMFRAKYIDQALEVFRDPRWGVEVVGSVSRNQMARELSQAEALLYPCDPTSFTETFCCAALEAIAAGAVPVLSQADCLSEIFQTKPLAVPMCAIPAREHMDEWTELAVRALTDKTWRTSWQECGTRFAKQYDWRVLAEKLETILDRKLKEKTSGGGTLRSPGSEPVGRLHASVSLMNSRSAEGSIEPSNSKRIDFVCAEAWENWSPITAERDGIGGSEMAVIEMAKRFAGKDYKVTVWSPTGESEKFYAFYPRTAQNEKLTIQSSGLPLGVRYTGREYPPKGYETDVLIAWRRADLLDSCSAKRKHLWLHDPSIPCATLSNLDQTDKIIVLGEWHKKTIVENSRGYDFKNQLYVSRGGIDPTRFTNPPARDMHSAVWMQSPERGLSELLDMWPAILKEVPDATLNVLYGFKTWETRVRTQNNAQEIELVERLKAKIKSSKNVALLGRVSREEHARVLQSSGVWLYPSWHAAGVPFYEMCPVSSMEAQAAGLRMVISPRGGLDEYAADRAFALIDGDPRDDKYKQEFIDASVSAMIAPEHDLRTKCRDYALANFGWDTVADDWEKNLL